jgi:ABC-type bacteriocin/lantibiotic exporter with double-glycine peptidase domain
MKERKKQSKLQFHKQEKAYSCAVACLKMVLHAFDKDIDEGELRKRCNTTELGTFADDIVTCAIELGFNAEKAYLITDDLKKLREEGFYPIAYVNTYALNGIFATHAIIVEEIADGDVMIIDPIEGRKTIPIAIFNRLWDTCNNLTILLKPSF